MEQRKTEQLQIRVTPAQKAALRRAASAAGEDLSAWVLSRALPPTHDRIAAIMTALQSDESRKFALAALNELLVELTSVELEAAFHDMVPPDLSPFVSNYVAAMVEQAAAMKGSKPPTWVRSIPPLEMPHFGSDLAGLRPYLLAAAPVPFRRRNIFVDSGVGDRV
ncbi:MAG: DUF1778 domain-containing protein [Gemmatimonadota bacterium]